MDDENYLVNPHARRGNQTDPMPKKQQAKNLEEISDNKTATTYYQQP